MNILYFQQQIKPGDFITVVRWKGHQDNSYRGYVLCVQAVDLPFLVVKATHGYLKNIPMSLSLDMVEVKHLSDDCVKAMQAKEEPLTDKLKPTTN